MWQVYLFLANERQAVEQRRAAEAHPGGASRVRRWRLARRVAGQGTASVTRGDANTSH